MVSLGPQVANGVSADGSVVVGSSGLSPGYMGPSANKIDGFRGIFVLVMMASSLERACHSEADEIQPWTFPAPKVR
jgi:hypothetical protein